MDTFAGPQPGEVPARGWDNHRWIRFRTATSGLDGWLGRVRAGYACPTAGATPYPALAGPGATVEMPSYKLTKGRREVVNERTRDLIAMAGTWAGDDAMSFNAPEPRPQLRLVPDDGTAVGLAVANGDGDPGVSL